MNYLTFLGRKLILSVPYQDPFNISSSLVILISAPKLVKETCIWIIIDLLNSPKIIGPSNIFIPLYSYARGGWFPVTFLCWIIITKLCITFIIKIWTKKLIWHLPSPFFLWTKLWPIEILSNFTTKMYIFTNDKQMPHLSNLELIGLFLVYPVRF